MQEKNPSKRQSDWRRKLNSENSVNPVWNGPVNSPGFPVARPAPARRKTV